MSSSTEKQAVNMALALCRDAFGNLYSGNDERGMRFLTEAVKVLSQLSVLQQSGDFRAEKALSTVLSNVPMTEESFPKHIRDNAEAAYKKWEACGISPDGVLGSLKVAKE